ncbi:MAG: DUF5596 domain-containing protein [Clostridia bacterium]|nr:DUF5596 domain-containing protein [Clostridia bacterium]
MEQIKTYAENIKAFAEKITLPAEAIQEALPVCETVFKAYAEVYNEIKANAYDKDDNDGVLSGIKAIAEKEEIHQDLAMLAVVLMLGMDAKSLYDRKNLSEKIYFDSMKDIAIWTKTCMTEAGHVGLYEFGWIMNFIRADIIRLHRLEFHEISFDPVEKWEKAGLTVKDGDRVINIHVPEDGPLTHDDVIESYRQAYRHFGRSGTAAFVCHSWLLYPGLLEFLPENSNIRKFAEDFEIVETDHKKNYGELWRVFGKRKSYVPSELPRNNSLQRGLADYLAAHDNVTGAGYGIFAFDGEKVIK